MKSFQIAFCFNPREWWFGFERLNIDTSWSHVYEWVLGCGFFEIRKWKKWREK